MGQRWVCAATICFGLSSQVVAEERPKTDLIARASCTVVRYYVAKYTVAVAEAWARNKGATEGLNQLVAQVERKGSHFLEVLDISVTLNEKSLREISGGTSK